MEYKNEENECVHSLIVFHVRVCVCVECCVQKLCKNNNRMPALNSPIQNSNCLYLALSYEMRCSCSAALLSGSALLTLPAAAHKMPVHRIFNSKICLIFFSIFSFKIWIYPSQVFFYTHRIVSYYAVKILPGINVSKEKYQNSFLVTCRSRRRCRLRAALTRLHRHSFILFFYAFLPAQPPKNGLSFIEN